MAETKQVQEPKRGVEIPCQNKCGRMSSPPWRCGYFCDECAEEIRQSGEYQPSAPAEPPGTVQIPAERVVELSKLYLDVALNMDVGSDETRQAAIDTVYALAELEISRERLGRAEARIVELEVALAKAKIGYEMAGMGCNFTDAALASSGKGGTTK